MTPLIRKLIEVPRKIILIASELISFLQYLKRKNKCVCSRYFSRDVFSEYITSQVQVII
jgi:hypothetical protein